MLRDFTVGKIKFNYWYYNNVHHLEFQKQKEVFEIQGEDLHEVREELLRFVDVVKVDEVMLKIVDFLSSPS